MAVRIGFVMLHCLNDNRPENKVECPQASKASRLAEIAFRRGRQSDRWRQINEPPPTLRSISRRCNARPLHVRITCSTGASARRDRFAGRWFGGRRRTRSSSGTHSRRTKILCCTKTLCQGATRGRSEDSKRPIYGTIYVSSI